MLGWKFCSVHAQVLFVNIFKILVMYTLLENFWFNKTCWPFLEFIDSYSAFKPSYLFFLFEYCKNVNLKLCKKKLF